MLLSIYQRLSHLPLSLHILTPFDAGHLPLHTGSNLLTIFYSLCKLLFRMSHCLLFRMSHCLLFRMSHCLLFRMSHCLLFRMSYCLLFRMSYCLPEYLLWLPGLLVGVGGFGGGGGGNKCGGGTSLGRHSTQLYPSSAHLSASTSVRIWSHRQCNHLKQKSRHLLQYMERNKELEFVAVWKVVAYRK